MVNSKYLYPSLSFVNDFITVISASHWYSMNGTITFRLLNYHLICLSRPNVSWVSNHYLILTFLSTYFPFFRTNLYNLSTPPNDPG